MFRSQIGIPELIKNLLIINVLMFLGTIVLQSSNIDLYQLLSLHLFNSDAFKPYQVITHMFMHGGFFHLFFNMLVLWMFGSRLEMFWGPRRLFIFYFLCGIGAAIIQSAVFYYQFTQGDLSYYPRMVGASGAIFGLLTAFAMYWPNTELYIMFIPIPVKAKYAVPFFAFLELSLGVGNFSWDNIAHFAHLGGALVGFILVKIWNKTNRNSLY